MIPQIGTLLSSRYNFSSSFLENAATVARKKGIRIGQYLLESSEVNEYDLYESLAHQFSMPFTSQPEILLTNDIFREFPADLFRNASFLPVAFSETSIHILISDPLDIETIQEVEIAVGLPVACTLTLPTLMTKLFDDLTKKTNFFSQSAVKITKEYEQHLQIDDSLSVDEIKKRTEAEPVVKMASLIFNEAIKLGASDIHIEPSEHHATVRFRIDGLLHQHTELSKWMFSPLTSRIKIQADLDIAEKRSPQDGRIRYTYNNSPYDFRVSTLPTQFGEKTVVRILKHDHSLLDLTNIGMSNTTRLYIEDLIEKPQGMIFVTGPTGSGKSSTLFSCINKIRHKAINITTIENPIEYKIDGVNQVQINEKAGVTFASALRSILRQDPDVIFVGEIRDSETAQIAVQSAQTGHLVLSTLHTNDAVSAINRLRDLGIPPFLISSSLLAVIAQRLIRVLCSECKKQVELSDVKKRRWKKTLTAAPPDSIYEPVGCQKCNGSGYFGRTALFELVIMNDSLREQISENASETAIRTILKNQGFSFLLNDGIEKVYSGITTPEEIFRIVQIDESNMQS